MSPDALAARLAALERSHARLRRLVAVLVLALLAALLVGAGKPAATGKPAVDGVISGRSLKLLDDQGRVRVLLNTNAGLSFLDANGHGRATIGLDGTGFPGLVFNGDGTRAILNVNADGPALTMTGTGGALRAILALVKGQPGLVLFDGEEHERAKVTVEDGNGRGMLQDADGGISWRIPNHD